MMRARLTAFEPNDLPLTTSALLVVNCVKKFYLTSLKTLPSTVPLVFISSATSSLSVLPSSMFFASQRPHENLPRNTMYTVTSYRAADNNRLSGNVRLQFAHARPRISFLKRKTVWLSVLLVWTPSGLRVKLRAKRTQQLPTLLAQQCWELIRPFARGYTFEWFQQHATGCANGRNM